MPQLVTNMGSVFKYIVLINHTVVWWTHLMATTKSVRVVSLTCDLQHYHQSYIVQVNRKTAAGLGWWGVGVGGLGVGEGIQCKLDTQFETRNSVADLGFGKWSSSHRTVLCACIIYTHLPEGYQTVSDHSSISQRWPTASLVQLA